MQPWDSCDAMFGSNTEKRCVGCGTPLVGRQRVWCSGDCDTLFWQHHAWGEARKAVIKRDRRRCVKCGTRAHYMDSGRTSLEVNHKVPVLGKHGQNGCWHHNDGLETLCHDCHVQVTARQFGYRTAA